MELIAQGMETVGLFVKLSTTASETDRRGHRITQQGQLGLLGVEASVKVLR